jgi:hypothetical protein
MSERVALAKEYRAVEAPKAAERRAERQGRPRKTGAKLAPVSGGKTCETKGVERECARRFPLQRSSIRVALRLGAPLVAT